MNKGTISTGANMDIIVNSNQHNDYLRRISILQCYKNKIVLRNTTKSPLSLN